MADEQIIVIKKKSGHGGHHGGAWKVAYADFVTAMMALFIVLWLMNSSKSTQEDIGGYFRDPHGISEKKGIGLGGKEEITAPKDNMAKLKNEMMQSLKKMPEFDKISKQVEFSLTPEGLRVEMIEIGNTTNFNGENVFSSNSPTSFLSTQASLATTTALTAGSKTTITDAATGGTFVFTAGVASTVADLQAAIGDAVTAGTLSAGTTATLNGTGNLVIGPNTATTGIQVTSNDTVLGPMDVAPGSNNSNTVFISDGTTTGASNTTITTTIASLSSTSLNLGALSLTSTSGAQSALTAINAAISQISAQRGQIGASVNRLQAATTVMSTQVQNLQSASNSIEDADIGKTVAQMTQFNILQSTGMAALQQANSASQNVLKLLQ
jgi:flagellin-like hook-associated protein FlgL